MILKLLMICPIYDCHCRYFSFILSNFIGILDLAIIRQLINLTSVIKRLQKTNFRISNTLIQSLIKRHLC